MLGWSVDPSTSSVSSTDGPDARLLDDWDARGRTTTPMARTMYLRLCKRSFDVIGAVALLVVLSPLLASVWLSLRCTLGPGVVLRQERIGRSGRTYACLKFRTMAHCRRERSRDYNGPNRRLTHKSDADPRHTRLGRLVRRYSLDEVLQLVNVVRGEMSLVGPRPEMASVATAAFLNHRRHAVRPGLTGPYQVSELRTNGRLVDGLELDEAYVDTVSLGTDLRLLAATAVAVARGSGS
ncbi:MAG: sugar transferase [Acidimicrobiales bacterium]